MVWMSLVFWNKGGAESQEAIQRRSREVLLDVPSKSVIDYEYIYPSPLHYVAFC